MCESIKLVDAYGPVRLPTHALKFKLTVYITAGLQTKCCPPPPLQFVRLVAKVVYKPSQANSISSLLRWGDIPQHSSCIQGTFTACTDVPNIIGRKTCRHWMSYIDVKPLTVMKLAPVNYWIIYRQNCFLSLTTNLNAEIHLVLIIAGWLVHTHPVLVDSCKLEVHILRITHRIVRGWG